MSNKTHGLGKHPLYDNWYCMMGRCYNAKRHDYKWYGGRGITVCDEWRNSLVAYYEWSIKNGWSKGLELDRKDGNKGYSPNNCRWVTSKVNNNNRRNNKLITAFGRTQSASQWAQETGMERKTIIFRIERFGYTPEEALTIKPSYSSIHRVAS